MRFMKDIPFKSMFGTFQKHSHKGERESFFTGVTPQKSLVNGEVKPFWLYIKAVRETILSRVQVVYVLYFQMDFNEHFFFILGKFQTDNNYLKIRRFHQKKVTLSYKFVLYEKLFLWKSLSSHCSDLHRKRIRPKTYLDEKSHYKIKREIERQKQTETEKHRKWKGEGTGGKIVAER